MNIVDPRNFAVRVGGEYKCVRFENPALAEALRGANVVKADFIVKYLGGFNRLLSSFIKFSRSDKYSLNANYASKFELKFTYFKALSAEVIV